MYNNAFSDVRLDIRNNMYKHSKYSYNSIPSSTFNKVRHVSLEVSDDKECLRLELDKQYWNEIVTMCLNVL